MKHRGRAQPATRILWRIMYGEIPDDGLICHRCDNPSCVNPEHLYLGTFEDNMRDKRDRNRVALDKNPRWKGDIDTEAAWHMYNTLGMSQQVIADKIGISQSALSSRFKRKGYRGDV